MRRFTWNFLAALAVVLPTPALLGAQATVVVTVLQSLAPVGTAPASGAAVCFTSNNNTQMTTGSGQVSFRGIPVGAWSGWVWKSGFKSKRFDVTVPSGASVIPSVVTLAERSTEAPPCIVPRLGEEKFPVRGKAPLTTSGGERTLDCHQFSQSHVLTGVIGKRSDAIDQMMLVCAKMQGGALSPAIIFTENWDDEAGLMAPGFRSICPAGRVVSGLQVTVHPESRQIRSATIQCKTIGTNGLTTGTAITLAPFGLPTSTQLPLDACNGGRPARAIRAGADGMTPVLVHMLAPMIIATTQLICEQPLM